MPQSGVGRIQRRLSSNERKDTHERGTHPQCYQLNGHTEGGMIPRCNPTYGHKYFHRGGGRTHNITQRMDTQIFFDTLTKLTDWLMDKAIYWGSLLPKNLSKCSRKFKFLLDSSTSPLLHGIHEFRAFLSISVCLLISILAMSQSDWWKG